MSKAKGLGRGLEALLGADERPRADAQATLAVDSIQPGRHQPRTRMDPTALAELSASIRAQGLMQPVLVRPVAPGRYELIAGERRWRAAQLAGLEQIPALVREVRDEAALAMSLIENIQREDLNPIEEANGLQRLVNEFHMTHERAADAVGRSRSATSNLLRLLKLTSAVQAMLMEGELEMGHARALLGLEGARQVECAKRVAARSLSVRATEVLVARTQRPAASKRDHRGVDRDLARLEEEISERLGTTVRIAPGKKTSGRIIIQYAGYEHLERLLAKLRSD